MAAAKSDPQRPAAAAKPAAQKAPAKTASQPTGSTTPAREAPPKVAGREAGRLLEPLSYNEARKGLHAAHRGAARLIGSKVQLEASDFDEAGDAFKDVADRVPGIRIVIRIVAPLILIGALVDIWRRILAETPWWQRLRERRRSQEAENAAAQAAAAPRSADPPSTERPLTVAAPVPAPGAPPAEQPPVLPARGPALRHIGGR